MSVRERETIAFGDFQTPLDLARRVCRLLSKRGLCPASVVEPTCGTGHFLLASVEQFSGLKQVRGFDINPGNVQSASILLQGKGQPGVVRVRQTDFFKTDWGRILRELPEPLLVIGNPPWVTSAQLSTLGSGNHPPKTNDQHYTGIEALTGKSNFDISEWMLRQLLGSINGRRATLAVLCKTAVARRVLVHAWQCNWSLESSEIYRFDAASVLGVAVDACLLVCIPGPAAQGQHCRVFRDLDDSVPAQTIACRDGLMIADLDAYERWKHLQGKQWYRWRSGIKHDCARVMELFPDSGHHRNGLGEVVELEETYLYPLLKSSEVARESLIPKRWMLVPQRTVGADTSIIRQKAPKTWRYLMAHAAWLDRRASSVYRRQPRFAIFGVGHYSFAPWKVAISGFYKRLTFAAVGSFGGKPIVLDDTAYFVPCRCRGEAEFLARLFNSRVAREFYSAFVFWDAKRPVTLELLRRLDLFGLAQELGAEKMLRAVVGS
jgi:hypothetical protein